jgi:hypothetical protein
MFTSICSSCSTLIETQTDQSLNPNFRCKNCSKSSKSLKNSKSSKSSKSSKNSNHTNQYINEISMDVKYGPKVIHGWTNYYSSFILPTSWTHNNVRCNRCHKRFMSQTVPDYCPSCTDYYPVDLTCVKCNKTEHIAPRSYKKHNNMCIECFNSSIFEFKCDFCNTTYDDSHNAFNMLNKHVCPICRTDNTYKNELLHNYYEHHNELIDTILQLHDDNSVEITYTVKYSHVKYCGYHDKYYDKYYDKHRDDEYRELIKQLPLMKMFDYSDVSNLMSNQDFIDIYTMPDGLQCGIGCYYVTYTITNISI